jgi:hypothetical protein
MTEAEFRTDLRGRKQREIRMRLGVIADDVAAGGSLFDETRAFADEAADQEECGFRMVTVEQVQKVWGDRGIWSVVESDGQLARRIGSANSWPEEL